MLPGRIHTGSWRDIAISSPGLIMVFNFCRAEALAKVRSFVISDDVAQAIRKETVFVPESATPKRIMEMRSFFYGTSPEYARCEAVLGTSRNSCP